MRRAIVILAACCLAACGGGESATEKAGAQAAEDGLSPEEAAEEVYVTFLEEEGIVPSYGTAEEALALGRDLCDRYDRGEGFLDILATLTDTGFSGYEAGQINGAATAAFCPEHTTS